MYEELNRQETKLSAQRRRAELGTSLAMIAHEIRTPLTSIQLAVEMARRARDRVAAGASLKRAEAEVKRVDRMLESLLARSRAGEKRTEIRRVADLADRAVEFIRLKYGGRIRVRIVRDYGDEALIRCDPDALHQALVNIMDNSVKARNENRPLRIEVRSAVQAGFVTITIRDNGRGMSHQEVSGLFERFSTTGAGGTGLGLRIAKQTVEKYGGTIRLDSVEEAGTTAIITLPTSEPGRRR